MTGLLARVATVAVALFLALHGLIHLMGVALLWKLGEPGALTYGDAVPTAGSVAGYPVGGLWLFAGGLLVAAAWLLFARSTCWQLLAACGALLSSVVITLNPDQAVAGLVANALVLLLVAGSWLSARRAPSRLTRGASA
jgi:hypothetical protein